MLARMDIISINCPHTPATFHLLSARRLALLRPAAIIVNTSRGEVIDEAALTRMLRNKQLAGAGLDVFEHEPAINPRMRELDNVVLLPHMGSATIEGRVDMGEKVVINMGIGEGVNDRKKVEAAANDLGLIAGQKAVITKARKSIATFKVRDGQPIGCKVTLRKTRMYEFVDRLINIALPRVRDFRGLSPKSFDGGGNFTIGIKEHIIFPEIDYDKVADVWGMDITVCTSAKTDDEARALLSAFNFPFLQ